MPGEAYDAVDIDDDGARGEVAQVHIFDHAATKRSHDELPFFAAIPEFLVPSQKI
jgi:hypothetical protein